MTANIKIKKHYFTIEPSYFEKIKNEIMKLDGVESIDIKANQLIISYDLKQNNYQALKNYLTEMSAIKTGSFLSELKSSVICFREQNEKNHEYYPAGWDYYVQILYLGLHRDNHN